MKKFQIESTKIIFKIFLISLNLFKRFLRFLRFKKTYRIRYKLKIIQNNLYNLQYYLLYNKIYL